MEQNNTINMPHLQWYPGHMRKAERLVQENLKLVDDKLIGSQAPRASEIYYAYFV